MEKEYRLKKNKDIAKVVSLRNRTYCDNFIIYYKESKNHYKVAISVSKKYGKAYERNLAKRRMREALRHLTLYNYDYVIVIKDNFKDCSFERIINDLNFCLSLIRKKNIKKENN